MSNADRPLFQFDNTFARDLPGLYRPWKPAPVPRPRMVFFNRALAEALGLDPDALDGEAGAAIFGGNAVPEGAEPIAQAYAGHQFGGFSPQLGDGRALLLGEVLDPEGRRHDIALKGSGRTPFSRGGDGKASLAAMLREVLVGEAMHALGIPTTRALAVVETGEPVYRETVLRGAVLTRVASSHLRVGTFEFQVRRELEGLRRLADHAIARHDPELAQQPAPARYLELLRHVTQRQAALVARWMNVGFIHGVMNTDNMTLSGETIDYGPCAFMEAYDPEAVFSSIDRNGRYAYGNQPAIAQWNLTRLAEALLPLMLEGTEAADADRVVADATAVIESFADYYPTHLLEGQRAKLGLEASTDPADAALAEDWLALMHADGVDFTLGWRHLGDAAAGDDAPLERLFADGPALKAWLTRWRERCAEADRAGGASTPDDRRVRMGRVNPWIIARNHRVEEALAAASAQDDFRPFERLLDAVRHPWDATPQNVDYAQPAAKEVTACYRTYCGT
ncbi:MAG TPA: YdiU family protein [Variovorax sp.]|nr:YdiU family protein [Variovorax sp.]